MIPGREITHISTSMAVERVGSEVTIHNDLSDEFFLYIDDIAPLVRFLRQHFPEQVAEGMKEPRE